MEHFTKELAELKARAAAGRHTVGSTKDLQEICKGVDDLASFKEEVLECTKVQIIIIIFHFYAALNSSTMFPSALQIYYYRWI